MLIAYIIIGWALFVLLSHAVTYVFFSYHFNMKMTWKDFVVYLRISELLTEIETVIGFCIGIVGIILTILWMLFILPFEWMYYLYISYKTLCKYKIKD